MTAPSTGARGTTRVRVPILGMTCAACETRVTKALDRVPGVHPVSVSARSGMATLDVDGDLPWEGVVDALDRAGYSVGRTPWLSPDRRSWIRALGALVAVVGIVLVVTRLGFGDVVARMSDGAGSLTIVLLLGLTAGVSTCMALVGGLVLAVSASRAQTVGESEAATWRPQFVFQAGRIGGCRKGL